MKGFFRRNAWLLFSVSALGTALLFTPSLWVKFDGWVADQRDRVWEALEGAVGQRIVYDRIAPNVLAALDFQNVRMVSDGGETLFKAASVRLSWDWGMLFQGKFDKALRRVQVINAALNLDAARDRLLLERWSQLLKPQSSETPFGFVVEGFNVAVQWSDEGQTLNLDRGFAVLSPEGSEWGIKFRGALTWAGKGGPPRSARLSVRGEMRSDVAFRNLSVRTEVSLVKTTWFDLEPVSLQATVAPDRITIAKVSDRNPFDLQATWTAASQVWELRGAADNFKAARLIRLKGLQTWSRVTEGTLTGSFSYKTSGSFSVKGRASWPAGALPAPFADAIALQGAVSTQGGGYRLEQFHVETPRLSLLFGGLLSRDFLPEGDLTLERWDFPGLGRAKGRVHLSRTGGEVAFAGQDWMWNALGSRAPSGTVERVGDGWKFSIQGPWDGTEAATYSAQGLLRPGHDIQAVVELIGLPLSLLRQEAQARIPGFDLPEEVWALETTLRAQVGWDSQGPAVSVTSFAFHDPLLPDRTATGTGSWRGRHLDLALNPASWDSVRIGGVLSADLEDNGVVGGTLKGQLWNHPFELVGRWVPSDRTFAFSGKPGVSGVFHQNDAGWQAQLSLEPQELSPGWTLGFETEAWFGSDSWSVDASQINVTGKFPWNLENFSARTRLHLDQSTVLLEGLTLLDTRGQWSGTARTSWSPDFGSPWVGTLTAANQSREAVTLEWVVQAADRGHVGGRVAALDVTRAPLPPNSGLVGRVTAEGAVDWNGPSVDWSVQTAMSEARLGDSPLGFRATFSGKNQAVHLRGLNVSVSPLRLSDASFDLDLGSQTWGGSLGLGMRLGPGDWDSRWQLQGGWSGPEAPLRVSGILTARDNVWAGTKYPDWGVSASWSRESWKVSLANGGLSAQGDGSAVSVSAVAPFPVRGQASGAIGAGGVNLSVRGFQADLSLIKDLVNSPFFSITSGTAEGDFALGGTLADPEINGQLLVRGLTATSKFVRQSLGPVDVPLVLEGHRLRIDPINVGPGGQTWMFSGGARLDHLLPEEYQFAIQTDSISVIPVSYEYTEISASGGVNGLILLKGNPLSLTIGGRLTLQDAVITLKPTTPEAKSGEPLGFNADLTLVTGRKVEFLWPNQTLPLLRAVTAPGQSVIVKANDVASTWSVVGRLGLKTGEINYLNRTFLLKEGQLSFRENQSGFDPRILVRAEWKLRETTGPVIINLRADGTLATFSPRFDAVPYKSPEELQQLVGTTLALPTDYTKATNMDTALSVASDVGTSFLLTPFEETVKRNFQLDLFTVKTEILKKSLLNRNGAQEASDYLDNTRLFFGKYIGDDLFLQGTLAFRRDGSVATQVSPKLVVEPEFQMEFQTPFFLLNWTLLPQHPETLFVTDNTVTFRWNWSY